MGRTKSRRKKMGKMVLGKCEKIPLLEQNNLAHKLLVSTEINFQNYFAIDAESEYQRKWFCGQNIFVVGEIEE